jgi:glycosyltransferase involved in cell wall biosynthesis
MTGVVWLDTTAIILAAMWLGRAVLTTLGARALLDLPAGDPTREPPGGWPRVSVVVPSQNDELDVRTSIDSLLAGDYPNLEVIAVDDRSTDRTGAILDEIAEKDQRVRAVHIRELPDGWIGKPHALLQGTLSSTGDWLLFTDADVRFRPATLRKAVARAIELRLDFFTLIPDSGAATVVMRAINVMSVGIALLVSGQWMPWRRTWRFWFMGVGAFMLVRREAYFRAGGHEKIRGRMVDDLSLGCLLSASGCRCDVGLSTEELRVPYAARFGDLIRVTQKNCFAIFDFSWTRLISTNLITVIFDFGAPLLPIVSWRLWPAALVIWACIGVVYLSLARRVKAPAWSFLLHPLISVLLFLPTWGSALATSRAGGVQWRETFYPLSMLKGRAAGRAPGL